MKSIQHEAANAIAITLRWLCGAWDGPLLPVVGGSLHGQRMILGGSSRYAVKPVPCPRIADIRAELSDKPEPFVDTTERYDLRTWTIDDGARSGNAFEGFRIEGNGGVVAGYSNNVFNGYGTCADNNRTHASDFTLKNYLRIR